MEMSLLTNLYPLIYIQMTVLCIDEMVHFRHLTEIWTENDKTIYRSWKKKQKKINL